MKDGKYRFSRRTIIGGALALSSASLVRQTSVAAAAEVSPQLAELYEKAKPEGEVTIWAPGSPPVQWIPPEFAKRFPAVKVNWLGDNQASSRLITILLPGISSSFSGTRGAGLTNRDGSGGNT